MRSNRGVAVHALIAAGLALAAMGCNNTNKDPDAASSASGQPKAEHPQGEHPQGEHPQGEHPEHPKGEHPK